MSAQKRRSSSLENENQEVAKRDAAGRRGRPVSLVRSMTGNIDNQLAGQVFDHFCSASTLKSILRSFRYLCEILRLKPNQLPFFYPKLKANLSSWKAQALWTKLDKRASQKCYNRGKACAGTRVLIIGAGPCGLRTAIEAQLLGAKVVVVEKRDRYSRNNVLHLWPYNIHELRALGAKKFYGKFCAGSIDHISIRQLQCILLKVSLLLGVEVFEGVSFEDLIEPTDQETGWRAKVEPADHPVSQYEFDVLIGADGKRNTLAGFKRKEFRGKLAIAITANFIHKHSEAEGRVEEISGVAFIFNQKFFNDLNAALGISLENIVYYKDETHYFVMTAKKQSLLNKGVLIENHPDPSALLASDNINQEALFQYAREAADFATKGQLPHLDFAVNHYGKPDVAMFDFTSMYAADYAARVVERHGHRLLQCLVGDSLLEPFWPTGTGCPRGFFSAMDAMWLMKQLDSGKMSVLDCLAERESIHRILSQTTPSNTCKNFATTSIDPTTRYPTVNLKLVLPFQVTHLYDTDNPTHLQPQNVLQDSTPRKKKRKNSSVSPGNLLSWIQKQVECYNLQVTDMKACFQNGLILCAIVHRYRPDLVQWDCLDESCHMDNLQFVFDVLEHELGLQPVTTAQEIQDNEKGEVDKLAVISYLTGVYELFRREIPQQPAEEGGMNKLDDLEDSVYYHNHREKMENKRSGPREETDNWSIGQLLANDSKRRRRRSLETIDQYSDGETERSDWHHRSTGSSRRVSNKKRLAKLLEGAKLQETKHPSLEKLKPMDIRREESFQKIQELISGVAGQKDSLNQMDKKPKDLGRAIGRLDSEEWSFKHIQEREVAKKDERKREKVPKWSREAFNDKLKKVKTTLENPAQAKRNHHKIDASLNRLQKKLTEGTNLDTGERGANKVSTLVGELSSKIQYTIPAQLNPELKRESSNVWQPTKVKSSRSSDNCHFCKQKVYVVERMSAEAKFFHRACFRCDYCNILLRLGSYVFHREGRFAGKFFCIPHSTENALEKYRFKTKVDELQAQKDKVRREDKYQEDKLNSRFPTTLSPSHRERIKDLDRGGTPERAEFEASIDLSGTEDDRHIMDEDEWTDLNFGTSTNLDTSDDSISDLESDAELQGGTERPLTADETREIAREWRARQMLDRNRKMEEVRYTDQEYEDSSDPDIAPEAVPKIRTRRRGRRVTSSTEDTESITETEDSSNEEIKEIERRDNNPFNTMSIPKIVVDYNSPLMTRKGYPDNKYVSQTVPLSAAAGQNSGPTPKGTGLFNPGLTSNLYKYQFKTPDFTKVNQQHQQQQQQSQYRAISGIMSNNLKKNWVTPSTNQKNSTQKKVDPSEIDARLRSLMDRLSSQQSLLKPAEKPSAQMQHYLQSTNRKPEAYMTRETLSPTSANQDDKVAEADGNLQELSKLKNDPADTSENKTNQDNDNQDSTLDNSDLFHDAQTLDDKAEICSGEDSFTSLSDTSQDSDTSVESGLPELEKFEDVPEIMINLAEPESLQELESMLDSPLHQTTTAAAKHEAVKQASTAAVEATLASPEQSDDSDCDIINLCDTKAQVPSLPPMPSIEAFTEQAPRATSEPPQPLQNKKSEAEGRKAEGERILPKRRPSLLRTVVSIKGNNPESIVNYEIVDQKVDDDEKKGGIDFIDDQNSPVDNKPKIIEQGNKVKNQKTEVTNQEDNKSERGVGEHRSLTRSGSTKESKARAQPPNEAINLVFLERSVQDNTDVLFLDESYNESSTDRDPVSTIAESGVKVAARAQTEDLTSPEDNSPDGEEYHSLNSIPPEKPPLPSVEDYPPLAGSPPPSPLARSSPCADEKVDLMQEVIKPADNTEVWDALKSTNTVEKRQKLTESSQKQSNIVHDLIMGIPRQRRVRQPRATIQSSSVPLPPPSDSTQVPKSVPKTKPVTSVDKTCKPEAHEKEAAVPAASVALAAPSTLAATSTLAAASPIAAVSAPLAAAEDEDFPNSPGSENMILTVNEKDESKLSPQHSKITPQKTEPVKLRERSNSRSLIDSALRLSATISLPPTPITDPEKFGIKNVVANKALAKSDSKSQMTDSCSSFDTDGLDGIVSSGASPVHKSKSTGSSPAHKKGRGFMAAVTSIFRGSPSPITSPDTSKDSPVHCPAPASSSSIKTGGSSNAPAPAPTQSNATDLLSRMTRLTLKGRSSVGEVSRGVSVSSDTGTSPPHSLNDSKVELKPEDEAKLQQLRTSKLPPHLKERLEKRLSSKGQVQANRAAMSRVRRIQEIQRELGVVEVECADIEKEGVTLEKLLARADLHQHSKLMVDWYRLLGEKNELVRREQELMVESKQLELLDLADKLEVTLVGMEEVEATDVLDQLARIAEQREQLEEMLARDRERYKQEDLQIKLKMQEQGISEVGV